MDIKVVSEFAGFGLALVTASVLATRWCMQALSKKVEVSEAIRVKEEMKMENEKLREDLHNKIESHKGETAKQISELKDDIHRVWDQLNSQRGTVEQTARSVEYIKGRLEPK